MRITIDIPDSTRCVNVALVYQDDNWTMAMAATMLATKELKDGGIYFIPRSREVDNDETLHPALG